MTAHDRPGASATASHTATSRLLGRLLEQADPDRVTLGWLVQSLGQRSFGLIMFLLAVLGVLPGMSAVVAAAIAILAVEMILGRDEPRFPRRVAAWGFRTRHLARMLRYAVPVLGYLETFFHPRWATPFQATKRVVGVVALLLGALMLLPIPLSNIPPALTIMLIAIAYLEEDGLLLAVAMAVSAVLLVSAGGALWQLMSEMGWVGGPFAARSWRPHHDVADHATRACAGTFCPPAR
ncbi:MAG: exopolysaccharide biosynthesis protein [Alphaproteobacteria bacterium]